MYRGTWFGEGEVKVFLDGDTKNPSLVGTGTEDYIGSGWGQGEYACRYYGSLISNKDHDIYAFYRYHIADPVYFHKNCKVTIQQMGNAYITDIRKMIDNGANLIPVWFIGTDSTRTYQGRLLAEHSGKKVSDKDFPNTGVNFYRSDDVSATAYFYLNKPENNLPELRPLELRLKYLKEKVWDKVK
jgi:hypothetical protein